MDLSIDRAPPRDQQPAARDEQIQHYVYELPERTSGLFKYSRAEQKESVRVYLGVHVERESWVMSSFQSDYDILTGGEE